VLTLHLQVLVLNPKTNFKALKTDFEALERVLVIAGSRLATKRPSCGFGQPWGGLAAHRPPSSSIKPRGENADADVDNSNIHIRIRKMRIMHPHYAIIIRIRAVNADNKCRYYLLSAFEVMSVIEIVIH
jgi:hypothetical protein